jgi:zinc transport system ATP-binding protein
VTPPPSSDGDPIIEIEDLSIRFGEHLALMNLTLRIERGSFVAIVGPNGSGKSTLLRVLLGLIRPTGGRVSLFGAPPHKVDPAEIDYVPQLKTLDRSFPALAIELVVSGLRRSWPRRPSPEETARALQMLERVGAGHLARRPIGQLSGGELQRVYLARGFVRDPRLILLDEPATGMDVTGEADMYHILEKYQERAGATVLMVTHDWGAALHHATHVLLLNRRLVSYGSPSEALREHNLREAFGHLGHAHGMKLELGK